MTCHVCKAHIASGSRFCSICGSSTEPVAVAVTGGGGRSESLLAEANLYRLRFQWTEAEKRCVDVMRVDSHNVHAHVLLGDIYRDQGKLDEARQWYQMAVDLEPENRALQAKLKETGPARAGRGKAPRPPAEAAAAPKPAVSAALGTQNLMGLSPTNWFRVIWVFCGLFVVAVVVLILWIRAHPRTIPFNPSGTLTGIPSPVPDAVRALPNGTPRTPDNSVSGTQAGTVNGAPNGVPRPAPSLNSTTPLPPPGPSGNNLAAVTQREQALTALLSRAGALPEGVSVAAVRVDPQGQRVSVVLLQRAAAGVSEADLRAAIAHGALVAAQAVFAADNGCQSAIMETRLAMADGQAQPYFEAGIERAAAQRNDPSLQDEERFTNVFWASRPGSEGTNNP